MTKSIQGGCHCGNISYRYTVNKSLPELSVRICECSFCARQGAIYTSEPDAKLVVTITSEADIRRYQFASKATQFIFCVKCGVMPLSVFEHDDITYALINIRTADINISELSVRTVSYATESVAEALARRKASWIAHVEGI